MARGREEENGRIAFVLLDRADPTQDYFRGWYTDAVVISAKCPLDRTNRDGGSRAGEPPVRQGDAARRHASSHRLRL